MNLFLDRFLRNKLNSQYIDYVPKLHFFFVQVFDSKITKVDFSFLKCFSLGKNTLRYKKFFKDSFNI